MAMLISYLKTLKSKLQNPKICSIVSFAQNPNYQSCSVHNSAIQFILNEADEIQSSKFHRSYPVQKEGEKDFSPQKQQGVHPSIQISHPWREWVDLMEKLLKKGYFDEIGNPFASNGELSNKEANLIRTACLNFARDNYQLIRCFSREDLMILGGSGCPSTDRKVVNSGKRLRAHLGMNEGNVCSSCILRGDCDRAYVMARVDEGGRTVDVMRFLLTYSLDPVVGSVANKPCLNKRVKDSVRTLLKEMVEIKVDHHDDEPPQDSTSSAQENGGDTERMKQGDWICPKCNFHNFARNVKCLRCNGLFPERLKKLSEEQEHFPLKKGDWICDKCNFLNFARNTKCMQCKENPPKRQLNPGEWECDSCNYVNFRRNVLCLKCDHRRPIASNNETNVVRERPGGYKGDESLKFVESESEDGNGPSNQATGFKDFPVLGGKSDLSRDVHRHESWKKGMAAKTRTVRHEGKDSARHDSYIFRGTSDFHASGDDDDMDEWFGKRL